MCDGDWILAMAGNNKKAEGLGRKAREGGGHMGG